MIKTLTIRKYSADDIKKIHIRPEDKGRGLEDKFESMAAESYYDNDQIVGIAGAAKVNDNTCEVWVLLDECAKRYVREVYFYAMRFIDDILKYFGRVQAIVRADWAIAVHFLERLGFEREGLMKRFGPDGDDYFLYGRVKCQQ